ncbi:glycosyltransferase family 2 protein [Halobacteriovorax sp. GB3]|uniref:glycosyltransferase family 2 protein n=1 Tax=Halobacteriovorax sp. GB3 TaxID=2719615 RepID=UPI00235E3C97|nr:glycosyltransferase family 2 protein [Halobacteriovorax sp. GB3]MDD0851625.1 glycosyltransferase family 2 protein [Halobacteriovorax sp. GB3]
MIYVALIWKASRQVKKDVFQESVLNHLVNDKTNFPSFTIIIPAYNEELLIYQTVMSFIKLNYSNFEVIVVDDGSTDKTMDVLKEKFCLVASNEEPINKIGRKSCHSVQVSKTFKNLKVLGQDNGRKGSAINQGVAFAKNDWVCVVDADTIPEVDALYKMALYILNHPNYHGIGCSLRIANGAEIKDFSISTGKLPKNHISNFQIIEYIRSFFGGRIGWDAFRATLLLSGAFSAIRKDLILEVGGFSTTSIVEDLNFCMKCYRARGRSLNFKIYPEPLAWTQAPLDYRSLAAQRLRWQRGLIDSVWRFRGLFLNPKIGRVGFIHFPYLIYGMIIEPFIEVYSFFVMVYSYLYGFISTEQLLVLTGFTLFLVVLINISALSIEENYFSRQKSLKSRFRIIFYSVFEIIYYHQLLTLLNIYATFTTFGFKPKWGYMKRNKF